MQEKEGTCQSRKAVALVLDSYHLGTRTLPEWWTVDCEDRLALNNSVAGKVHVLATLDRRSHSEGNPPLTNQFDVPFAWSHRYHDSRAFFTHVGHNVEAWSDPLVLDHVLGGITWAAGKGLLTERGARHERARALLSSSRALQEADDGVASMDTSFEKDVLYEFQAGQQPMDLTIAPDGRVFIIVRNGDLLLFDPKTSNTTIAGSWNVTISNEDGLLGMALDPNFTQTGFMYVYWSPINQTNPTANVLSRYTFRNNTVDMRSEFRLLTIPTQRLVCCHSSGHVKFDPDGNLVLSIGENTYQTGWAPTDERPGSSPYDSQKAGPNTNDLRGKILRIRPTPTGYTIPEGNLFPADALHRPEIYAMGLRNPFRFAIDPLTKNLYVGDVGPDEYAADPTRGPMGYDEINQVLYNKPVNFGWPYCIANNKPYVIFNYTLGISTNKSYDCAQPVNFSPNNNGAQTGLPPSQSALVWYSYGPSLDFPQMNSNNNNVNAGRAALTPFFYRYDPNFTGPYKLPTYFDNSLFFVDWFRNQLRLVKLDNNANVLSITDLWPTMEWKSPMDIEQAPDGSLYIIEFGEGFSLVGARISRLRYLGAPSPVECIAVGNPVIGVAPTVVRFSSTGSNSSDGLPVSFAWDFTDSGAVQSTDSNPKYNYTSAFVSVAKLTVSTSKSKRSCTVPVEVTATGNTPPSVFVNYPPQGGVFTWGDYVDFRVSVTDQEDGSTKTGSIPCSAVLITPQLGHCPSTLVACHTHNALTQNNCSGTFGPLVNEHSWEKFYYLLEASYTDRGGPGAAPITTVAFTQIQPSVWQAEHFDDTSANITVAITSDPMGGNYDAVGINDGSWIAYQNWNLFNIETITFRAYSMLGTGSIDVRIGSTSGPIIASSSISQTGNKQYKDFTVPIKDTSQWFQIDMQVPTAIGLLILDPGSNFPNDYPAGYSLFKSDDGKNWGAPPVPVAQALHPDPTSSAWQGSQTVISIIPPITTRFLKIVQSGPENYNWWTITKLSAFSSQDTRAPLPMDNWKATAYQSYQGTDPMNALNNDATSRWTTGDSQRLGNVTMYFTFRSRVQNETNLMGLNYFTLNGQGISTTVHSSNYIPPVSTEF